MRILLLSVLVTLLYTSCTKQTVDTNRKGGIECYVHEEVTNADGVVERELIQLWQDYISEGKYEDPSSPYWSFANMKVPDENFWAIGINDLDEREYRVQCKIIGVFEVDGGYWSLISAFSHVDETGEIHLDVISAVYAKQVDGRYLLVSSPEYLKTVYPHRKVGDIDYYVHPFHDFKEAEAERMNAFNLEMAEVFGVAPLAFDYFVANNARDIARTWGYEYMNRMYNPSGKGGIASWQNMIIYAGNDSAFFPHELVHLYTFHLVPRYPHFWVGEGIATYFAGTSTYSFGGHMTKLKAFLHNNPDYHLSDITQLKKDIPNGEHASDFRYVIGGLLMGKIYEKEGIAGLVEALDYGTSDEDFFRLLRDKLGVNHDTFDAYVKEEAMKYSVE